MLISFQIIPAFYRNQCKIICFRYSSNNNILNITHVAKDYYRDEHWKVKFNLNKKKDILNLINKSMLNFEICTIDNGHGHIEIHFFYGKS